MNCIIRASEDFQALVEQLSAHPGHSSDHLIQVSTEFTTFIQNHHPSCSNCLFRSRVSLPVLPNLANMCDDLHIKISGIIYTAVFNCDFTRTLHVHEIWPDFFPITDVSAIKIWFTNSLTPFQLGYITKKLKALKDIE